MPTRTSTRRSTMPEPVRIQKALADAGVASRRAADGARGRRPGLRQRTTATTASASIPRSMSSPSTADPSCRPVDAPTSPCTSRRGSRAPSATATPSARCSTCCHRRSVPSGRPPLPGGATRQGLRGAPAPHRRRRLDAAPAAPSLRRRAGVRRGSRPAAHSRAGGGPPGRRRARRGPRPARAPAPRRRAPKPPAGSGTRPGRPTTMPSLTWYRAVIRQGWRRQLRRMFAAVGMPVARLVRVRIGTLRLDDLAPGAVRSLSAGRARAPGQRRAARDDGTPRRPGRAGLQRQVDRRCRGLDAPGLSLPRHRRALPRADAAERPWRHRPR